MLLTVWIVDWILDFVILSWAWAKQLEEEKSCLLSVWEVRRKRLLSVVEEACHLSPSDRDMQPYVSILVGCVSASMDAKM